jgi:hypothetical protein
MTSGAAYPCAMCCTAHLGAKRAVIQVLVSGRPILIGRALYRPGSHRVLWSLWRALRGFGGIALFTHHPPSHPVDALRRGPGAGEGARTLLMFDLTSGRYSACIVCVSWRSGRLAPRPVRRSAAVPIVAVRTGRMGTQGPPPRASAPPGCCPAPPVPAISHGSDASRTLACAKAPTRSETGFARTHPVEYDGTRGTRLDCCRLS